MSTQFTDGSFSDILPLPEAKQQFDEFFESCPEKITAFHVGTKEHIQEQQKKVQLEKKLENLSSRLDSLECAQGMKYPHIRIPTNDEVEKIKKQDRP